MNKLKYMISFNAAFVVVAAIAYLAAASESGAVSRIATTSMNVSAPNGPGGRKGEILRLRSAMRPSKQDMERGKKLYDVNCALCHGDKGDGNGPAGAGLPVPAKSFGDTGKWKKGRTVPAVFRTVDEGMLESGMPSSESLSAQDIFAILSYIRTLAKSFPAVSEKDVKSVAASYGMKLIPR